MKDSQNTSLACSLYKASGNSGKSDSLTQQEEPSQSEPLMVEIRWEWMQQQDEAVKHNCQTAKIKKNSVAETSVIPEPEARF